MTRTTALPEKLHQAMHRLPGMPAHGELIPLQARRVARAPAESHQRRTHQRRTHQRRTHQRRAHQARQPRVLQGWQRWIAAHVGRPLP